MERLTIKRKPFGYVVEDRQYQNLITTANISDDQSGCVLTYPISFGKAIDELGQLEDLMEKYRCDDIEHLEQKLELDLVHQNELCKLSYKLMSLENQLKNAIVPKFRVGQRVWCVDTWHKSIGVYEIETIFYHRNKTITYYVVDDLDLDLDSFNEENIFATKEEAEKKLEEIRNERN